MAQWATNLQQNSFDGIENVSIAYASLQQPLDSAAMIIVNGRSESYLKYQDIANYYFEQGYSVYMLDHRGQGLSQRLIDDTEKGHVIDFNDYVEDLVIFVNSIVLCNNHSRLLMLGHSMGGAIVARYLQTQPHKVERAILASPMFDIILPAPKPMVKLAASVATMYDTLLTRSPSYVLDGHGYQVKSFEDNDLTQSTVRFDAMVEVYQNFPKIQLGSPTNAWLLQALNACELCVKDAANIDVPLLLLQAGSDTIVDNAAQDQFCLSTQPDLLIKHVFADARHEILFELEHIRSAALSASENFLESVP